MKATLHVWESPRGSWNVTVRHANGRLGPHASGYDKRSGAARVMAGLIGGAKIIYSRPPAEKRRGKATMKKSKAKSKGMKPKGGKGC